MGKKRKIKEEFVEQANKVHNDKYDYSLFEYINCKTKGTIICPTHGKFRQTSSNHLTGYGCNNCARKIIEKSRRGTKEKFVERAIEIHNNKYDYSLFEYKNNSTKSTIICPDHGKFKQTAAGHLSGRGCKDCSKISYRNKRGLSLKKFIEQANKIHNNKYDYSLFEYKTARIKGTIICPDHGKFAQVPYSHLTGNGCPKCCKNFKKTKKEFLDQAHELYNNKYDYSLFEYVNTSTKGIIICSTHGKFNKTPEHHLRGEGCRKCSANVSKVSQRWLDELKIPKKYREVRVVIGSRTFVVDGYDPTTRTIYEFYGDFWHGNLKVFSRNKINPVNKKTFGKLYKETIKRENILKAAGYKIVSVWESEFLT